MGNKQSLNGFSDTTSTNNNNNNNEQRIAVHDLDVREKWALFKDLSELIIHGYLSTFEEEIVHNPEYIFLQSSKNFTYLHVAAYYNASKIVQFLLLHGCNPRHQDVIGSTVYHVAVYHDSVDVLKELCKYDTTDAVNVRTGFAENDTPLRSAISTNKDEIKRILLSHPFMKQCNATDC